MTLKNFLTKMTVGALSIGSIGVGAFGMAQNIENNGFAYEQSAKTAVVAVVDAVVDAVEIDMAQALSMSGGTVTIENTDLTNAETAVGNILTTVFEVLKLLPLMALIIGGFYLLDKLFSILPRPGGKQ